MNTGPYCLLCPDSYYVSDNGECLDCTSVGTTVAQFIGTFLGVVVLVVAMLSMFSPGETLSKAPHRTRPRAQAADDDTREGMQLLAVSNLLQRLQEATELTHSCEGRHMDFSTETIHAEVEDILVTTELILGRLTRAVSRHTDPRVGDAALRKIAAYAGRLNPVIDQIESCISSLSGAASKDVSTAVSHTRQAQHNLIVDTVE